MTYLLPFLFFFADAPKPTPSLPAQLQVELFKAQRDWALAKGTADNAQRAADDARVRMQAKTAEAMEACSKQNARLDAEQGTCQPVPVQPAPVKEK